MKIGIIKMTPAIVPRPWGEEHWLISDRPEGTSFAHSSGFDTFLRKHGKDIMGPRWESGQRFPLLIKNLICKEKLSVQVHPDENAAKKHGGEQKDEWWFVTDVENERAHVYAGFSRSMTQQQFADAMRCNDVENCLHKLACKCGEYLFIPAGRVHAIGGGVKIFEVQESSDTTYRVWDYNRLHNGALRPLHKKEALESINFDDVAPQFSSVQSSDFCELNMCRAFRVTQWTVFRDEEIALGHREQPRILYCTSGGVSINNTVHIDAEESALAAHDCNLVLRGTEPVSTILMIDNFFSN